MVPDAIRTTLESFSTGVESIEFQVLAIAAAGGTVLTERVDVFRYPGKAISLPVMGAFEVVDGKIAASRDYFDMNPFMSQLGCGRSAFGGFEERGGEADLAARPRDRELDGDGRLRPLDNGLAVPVP